MQVFFTYQTYFISAATGTVCTNTATAICKLANNLYSTKEQKESRMHQTNNQYIICHLHVCGCSNDVKYVISIECCSRRIDDFNDFLQAFTCDAFQFNLTLIALLHATGEHRPEVIRARDQNHFVHIKPLTFNKTALLCQWFSPAFSMTVDQPVCQYPNPSHLQTTYLHRICRR